MRYQINKGIGYMPGESCYDPTKPSWVPNTSIGPDDFWELGCYLGYNKPNTVDMKVPTAPPVSACAGTLKPDGTCVMVPSVNDPNNTAAQLPTNQQDFSKQWEAYQNSIQDSVTGLTPGGCLPGQTGTYPDCIDSQSTFGFWFLAIAGLAAYLYVTR